MAGNRHSPDYFVPSDLKTEVQKPKRQIGDRRGLRHGISFTTSAAMAKTEDWLEEHCQGKWSLELEGFGDTLSTRTYLVTFELESDKRTFKKFVRS